MSKFALLASGLLALTVSLPPLAHAQGQGGYAKGCPGAETVRMSPEERAIARAERRTNDMSHGRSSIDKSCKTWEGGGTIDGPQSGAINWRKRDAARGQGVNARHAH